MLRSTCTRNWENLTSQSEKSTPNRIFHWETGNNSNFPQLRLVWLTSRFNMAARPPVICGGNVFILQDTHMTVHLKLMSHVVTATIN